MGNLQIVAEADGAGRHTLTVAMPDGSTRVLMLKDQAGTLLVGFGSTKEGHHTRFYSAEVLDVFAKGALVVDGESRVVFGPDGMPEIEPDILTRLLDLAKDVARIVLRLV